MKKPPRRPPSGTKFNIYEAKSRLSDLVERAAKGEDIVISKRGKPMARLTVIPRPAPKFGVLKGQITIRRDFDAPLPSELQKYFEAGSDEDA